MSTLRTRLIFLLLLPSAILAQEPPPIIHLPPPDTAGGKPLMQALRERRSSREFSDRTIPAQTLSNLLWAAYGINRPDGHRTAPSARNWQEIDIYLAMIDGVFLYDARTNTLSRIAAADLRKMTGVQDFVGQAPLNLVYVADMDRVSAQSSDDNALFIGADCGTIVQNVYLFCSSEGLVTVVRGMVNREELAGALKLGPKQKVLLCQTVGYPRH